MIVVTESITIAEEELHESFLRAPGPGGQNVNKVETAVQLRFDVRASPSLPERVRARLLARAEPAVRVGQLTTEGVLVITADRRRSRERNRADALERLLQAIRAAAAPPPPPRRPTRPGRAARERRLHGKAVRSSIKHLRGRPSEE